MEETSASPVAASRATSAALRAATSSSSPSKRRRKQTTPSWAGESSSSSGVSRTRRSASTARSSARSIAARNASSPNVWIESQTFSARQPRVSCSPRSEKLTSPLVRRRVAQVVGRDLERAPQQVPLAHQQRAALDRLVEPLVRIERDRVGRLDPAQRRTSALGQRREAAVGGVDVQPHAVLAADLGELAQRIDRAGVGRARGDAREQRRAAGRDVGLDRARERRRRQPQVLPAGQDAQLVGPEAEQPRRAGDRRVRLVGRVGDDAVAHRPCSASRAHASAVMLAAEPPLTSTPAGAAVVAEPVLEPVEHGQLDLARAGRLHPAADVHVQRAGDEVAERARERLAGGDEGEVARMVGAAHERQHVGGEPLQRVGPRRGRRRLGEPRAHLLRRGPAQRRDRRVGEPVGEQVDDAVAERPHLFGRHAKRVRHRANLPVRASGYPPSGDGGIFVSPVICGIRMPSSSA